MFCIIFTCTKCSMGIAKYHWVNIWFLYLSLKDVSARCFPKAINKRISDISCNENVFNNAKITYEKALKNSGFTEGFTYIKPDNLTNIN